MSRKAPLQHAQHQALVHHKAGRLAPAIACYRRILTLLPLQAEANAQLGALLLQQGHAEQAVAHLERARHAQPHVLRHWLRLLSALQALGDVSHARELLQAATHFNFPVSELERLSRLLNEPPGLRQQGLVQLYRQGKHLNTEIAAYMFVQDYPAHPLGWQVLGAVLHDTGQLDKALQTRLKTVADFPNDANAHNNLAHTLLALGDYAQALVSARKALAIDPMLSAALQHEAQALVGMLK
jgi:tetratricopeptide (TPR) repeat protein